MTQPRFRRWRNRKKSFVLCLVLALQFTRIKAKAADEPTWFPQNPEISVVQGQIEERLIPTDLVDELSKLKEKLQSLEARLERLETTKISELRLSNTLRLRLKVYENLIWYQRKKIQRYQDSWDLIPFRKAYNIQRVKPVLLELNNKRLLLVETVFKSDERIERLDKQVEEVTIKITDIEASIKSLERRINSRSANLFQRFRLFQKEK